MSQSPAIAATMDGELMSSEGTQEGKNTCYLAAIRLQPLPMVSTQETQDLETEYWPQIPTVVGIMVISVKFTHSSPF